MNLSTYLVNFQPNCVHVGEMFVVGGMFPLHSVGFMFSRLGCQLSQLVGENVGCNVGAAVGFIVGAAVGVTQEALTPVAKLNSVRALPVNAAQRWCATSFTGRYVLSRRARKNGGFMSRGPITQAPCWLRKKRNSGAAVP